MRRAGGGERGERRGTESDVVGTGMVNPMILPLFIKDLVSNESFITRLHVGLIS